jgi:starvation-inducible DNA-binding protein
MGSSAKCLDQRSRKTINLMPPTKPTTTRIASNGKAAIRATFRTLNDIPASRRVRVVALLNARLADAVDLHMQMKQAHWNVKGPSFISLHELFDKVHQATGEYVDLIAERAVQLGGVAQGTVRHAARSSHLPEYPLHISSGSDHVRAVSAALASFGEKVRASIDEADELSDADSVDILTEVSRGTDKWLWFVEAHTHATT